MTDDEYVSEISDFILKMFPHGMKHLMMESNLIICGASSKKSMSSSDLLPFNDFKLFDKRLRVIIRKVGNRVNVMWWDAQHAPVSEEWNTYKHEVAVDYIKNIIEVVNE